MNTIKKKLLLSSAFLLLNALTSNFAYAGEKLDKYIKQNIDYITTSSLPLKLRKPYSSNNKKIYIIFGTTMALSPQSYDDDSLIRYISKNPSNFLGIFKDNSLAYIIDLSHSQYSKECLSIQNKREKLISSVYNIKKYPKSITVLLGESANNQIPECYQTKTFYLVPKTTLAATDAYQTYKYYQKILNNI